jgi:hypothetical protein
VGVAGLRADTAPDGARLLLALARAGTRPTQGWLASAPMPVVPEEHHPELLEAVLSADIAVLVNIDTKDVKVMFTETTDPRHTAHILRDIADGDDSNSGG